MLQQAHFAFFLRWLVLAALLDWLLTRTLTRLAIFIPKTPAMISGYEFLSLVGQVASSLAGLLVLVGLAWIIWHEWQQRRSRGLPLVLGARIGLSLLFLAVAPVGWLAGISHLLTLVVILLVIERGFSGSGGFARINAEKPTWIRLSRGLCFLLPALALGAGEVFHLAPALYALLGGVGPPPFTLHLFNLGELLAVLTPLALWWVWGRGASRLAWIGGLIPALVFAVTYLATPAMTGTIVIWSTGLTLYLPWPLYALSLWLAGTTVLACAQRGNPAAWGILLLACGGYVPQFSVQIFFSLIGLWLIVSADGGWPLAQRAASGASSQPLTASRVDARPILPNA